MVLNDNKITKEEKCIDVLVGKPKENNLEKETILRVQLPLASQEQFFSVQLL
jgi:hypothetical protein